MSDLVVNVGMAAAWNGWEGEIWARHWHHYDRTVASYHSALIDAAEVRATDRVYDIGCGTGQVTRDAGRLARAGSVVGVDLSGPMLHRARQLAALEQVDNVEFVRADAQVYRPPAPAVTLALSRFGVMFFADPRQAFAGVCSTLAPGGRLAAVAWRGLAVNEWLTAVFDALDPHRQLPRPVEGAVGPLGLADGSSTRAVLEEAGFVGVDLSAVDAPLWVGREVEDALSWWLDTAVVRQLSGRLDADSRRRALDRLSDALAAHQQTDGVVFRSGAWLITARRG
jgi:SAM-dependent methyltransferase